MLQNKFYTPLFVAITIVFSAMFLAPVGNVQAEVLCYPTNIGVKLNTGEIRAYCFQPGATVVLTIDDPGTAQNPDYSASETVPAGDYPMVIFLPASPFVLEPGFIIKVTDGVNTQELIFQRIAITKIDTQYNTVSGTAVPFRRVSVRVQLLNNGGSGFRNPSADANGNWIANFNYGNIVDIQNGMLLEVGQYDDDYDGVFYEKMILPRIEVNAKDSSIQTFGWSAGVAVTLEVDDLSTTLTPDCTNIRNATQDGLFFSRALTGCLVKAGDVVTIKGNDISTSYIVNLLKITKVDTLNDIIRGVADQNQTITLNMSLSGTQIKADTISDANGNWEFNFSEMIPPVDLVVGRNIVYVNIYDTNGNSTTTRLWLYPPYMHIDISTNEILGVHFQQGDLVTLSVDDPGTGILPDFQTTVIFDDTIKIDVNSSLHIKPGFVVEMRDSIYTRRLVVWDLSVNFADMINNRLYGVTGLPGAVWVDIYSPSPANTWLGSRYGFPDESGNWSADFSDPTADPNGSYMTVDIEPGYRISLLQRDNENNMLINNWIVPTNLPPVADAGGPYAAFSGETITLDASDSSDPDGEMLAYEWDLDFDGEYDDATGMTTAISFKNLGNFSIGLKVTDTGGLSDTDTAEVTVIPVLINIDIKPGLNPNPINLRSKGVIPVTVLTTAEFDASTLDSATVVFAGASPLRWTWQDVDWDGDMDLLLHFNTLELKLNVSSIEAILTGKTYDGIFVEGKDSVKIVPPS